MSECLYQKVDDFKKQVTEDLRSNSLAYYEIGIGIFHKSRMKNKGEFQPAIGNLAISVELLLKSVIAHKAIKMLYQCLSHEAQLLLCYPESLPENYKSDFLLNELKNFRSKFKTIQIDEAVSLFCFFYPELKKEYKQFFSLLTSIRNISVHASVQNHQWYKLEHTAFFSTKLFQAVEELNIFSSISFYISKETEDFLLHYEDGKVTKVRDALKKATEVTEKGDLSEPSYSTDDWNEMNQTCPICNRNGIYIGETEEDGDGDEENGMPLTFQCESYFCKACGLKLEDYKELKLANMETSVDRSDEINQWLIDGHDFDTYYDDIR